MPHRYCPFYCEENIWHLCEDPAVGVPVEERKVLVLTGARGRVAMLRQREGRGGPVLWDYHVVLGARGKVWDLDTTLGLPVDLDVWIRESFVPHFRDFLPRFRVVDARAFRSQFASDRSHMRAADGSWLQPPPPWEPIGKGMTLPKFVDMDADYVGELHTLGTLPAIFPRGPTLR